MERKARGRQEWEGSSRGDALIKRLCYLRTWELLDSVLLPALMVASARSVDQPLLSSYTRCASSRAGTHAPASCYATGVRGVEARFS